MLKTTTTTAFLIDPYQSIKVEAMIRSFLISAKEGVGLGSFANDYRVMCGEEVPYREFGRFSILLKLECQLNHI